MAAPASEMPAKFRATQTVYCKKLMLDNVPGKTTPYFLRKLSGLLHKLEKLAKLD
jgi:hypothetical protein